MTYKGHIHNGTVILDPDPLLPEGTEVELMLFVRADTTEPQTTIPSIIDRLKSIVGKAKGLPSDLAVNHDYYLHGQSKR
ncbi:MAG TPA: hypothetical protein PLI09_13935 [Candidatus Hydrogenedentes bacterium]|nr:hypothetical protein [Candidatus Hydrogenedentota bacterium]